jgi:oligoendopeptidase F
MNLSQVAVPVKKERKFLPQNLLIEAWETLEPFFEDLQNRPIASVLELEKWLHDRSELEAVLEEDAAWRYIKMNIDTTKPELSEAFNFFVTEIQPKTAPYDDAFNKKLVESPFLKELDQEKYFIYLRGVKKAIEIFREKNIPLMTEMQQEEQKYGAVCAKMTVEIDGEEMTLPKAARLLKDPDRAKRQNTFHIISKRRLEDKKELDDLFDHLVKLRHQVAINADFDNYRDYKFAALGRFDYSIADCHNFHESIAQHLVPLSSKLDLERKEALNLEVLKPWDKDADVSGKPALKPFDTGEELLDKSIECFYRIHPAFGEYLQIMKNMKYVDLDSKKGKAPGGFNYPLYEIGVPFIYMNSVGTHRDLVTMMHEGGHAIHSFLSRDLELTAFKNVPSEVAELASMSIELISMDHWDVFYTNETDLNRSKKEQLEQIISTLPWIAAIDKFQHWIYENPTHTAEQRDDKWDQIYMEFSGNIVNWIGQEQVKRNIWQKQLHLYEVPFYYIEYGFAQLGAIAVWRNYKQKPQEALDKFTDALKLGYTKPIGEIYRAAGIKFDFSSEWVKDLADFIFEEYRKINLS